MQYLKLTAKVAHEYLSQGDYELRSLGHLYLPDGDADAARLYRSKKTGNLVLCYPWLLAKMFS